MDFWPEDFVKKFIMSQLNFFLTDHPDSDAGRLELTNWKWWIWLEQHGYDFCRNSLRLMLIQYHGGDIPAFSYRQERVLMFQIRNKMREISGFPEFPPAMIESFVKSKTVDYGKHWSAASYRDGSIILDGQYISDIATNFSNFLSSRNPEIVKMINTLIEDASNGVYYYYEDNYTNNGKYKVQVRPFLLQMVMAVSCLPIFYNYFNECEIR